MTGNSIRLPRQPRILLCASVIHIIGAGIAGLALAENLTGKGIASCLYEKSASTGLEASGKNAGIIRTYEADSTIRFLARETLAYYRAHEPSLDECGLLLNPWEIDYSEHGKGEARTFLHNGAMAEYFSENGTVEPGLVVARLTQAAEIRNDIYYHSECSLLAEGGQITALSRRSDNHIIPMSAADSVVVAAGEGCVVIARNLPMAWQPGLIAHRRTLFEFTDKAGRFRNSPVEWNEHSGVYFRPAKDGIVATAGEQIPVEAAAGEDAADEAALLTLRRELKFLSKEDLVSTRNCRRLMPLDNRPYCGNDPKFKNLFWFTGLGGRGMSIAPALATELANLLVTGENKLLEDHFSPARAS